MNDRQWRARFLRAAKTAISGLALVLVLTRSSAVQASPRHLPDYDGRGGERKNALLWVPRVLLFPFYLTSEFIIRRPLGWLITSAEHAHVPAVLYNFLTFGPDHKAGFVPVAFFEFGFRPSVGVFAFWDDAGFDGHALRLHASTGGNNWFAASMSERFRLSPISQLSLSVGAGRRPDLTFFGLGPSTSDGARARYGADRFEGRATLDVEFLRSCRLESAVGFRTAKFRRGKYLGQATIEDRVGEGAFAVPSGYAEGYEAVFSDLKVVLDSRRPRAVGRSGLRAELDAEQGTDLKQAQPAGWLRYGAAAGAFLDLGRNARVVSLSVATVFSDPLGGREVPFTELATLGGPGLMPGFRTGRLRGRSAAVATLRYSWPIWVWLNGSLQSAVGNVFGEHLDGFELEQLRLSAAIGVESEGASNSTMQVLFGFGTETFRDGARIDSLRLTLGVRNGL